MKHDKVSNVHTTDWLAVVVAAAIVIIVALFFAALAFSTERSAKQVRAFLKTHPCPATNEVTTGPCKGWVVDHIVPLCWGGLDEPANMAWEEQRASYKKDVFERAACAMKRRVEAKETTK